MQWLKFGCTVFKTESLIEKQKPRLSNTYLFFLEKRKVKTDASYGTLFEFCAYRDNFRALRVPISQFRHLFLNFKENISVELKCIKNVKWNIFLNSIPFKNLLGSEWRVQRPSVVGLFQRAVKMKKSFEIVMFFRPLSNHIFRYKGRIVTVSAILLISLCLRLPAYFEYSIAYRSDCPLYMVRKISKMQIIFSRAMTMFHPLLVGNIINFSTFTSWQYFIFLLHLHFY